GFTPTSTTPAPATTAALASGSSSSARARTPSARQASADAAVRVLTATDAGSTPAAIRPRTMAPAIDPAPSTARGGRVVMALILESGHERVWRHQSDHRGLP